MKTYITAISGAAACLLLETMFAMIVYIALSRTASGIDKNALWIGCCIMAGCLLISVMLVAIVGSIPKDGK